MLDDQGIVSPIKYSVNTWEIDSQWLLGSPRFSQLMGCVLRWWPLSISA